MSIKEKLKCSYCRNSYFRNELTQVTQTRKACKMCLETKVAENKAYNELINYICNGFGQEIIGGHQLSDIKKFKELGYTYAGMQYTLYYMATVCEIKLDGRLGLIPYYYHEAEEFYKSVERFRKSLEGVTEFPKAVTIVRGEDTRRPKRHKTRYVNIEEL